MRRYRAMCSECETFLEEAGVREWTMETSAGPRQAMRVVWAHILEPEVHPHEPRMITVEVEGRPAQRYRTRSGKWKKIAGPPAAGRAGLCPCCGPPLPVTERCRPCREKAHAMEVHCCAVETAEDAEDEVRLATMPALRKPDEETAAARERMAEFERRFGALGW